MNNSNEVINDLNSILSSMPNATAKSLNPESANNVISDLQDLVSSLPSADGTIEVEQRADEMKTDVELLIEYYEELRRQLTARISARDYSSPRVSQLQARREELATLVEERTKDIEDATVEIENFSNDNSKVNAIIDNYTSSNNLHGELSTTTFSNPNRSRNNYDVSKIVDENNQRIETLKGIVESNNVEIENRRESLVTYNAEIASANEELSMIEPEIEQINTTFTEEAIANDNEALTMIDTNVKALTFTNEYNKSNPRETLQQIITSYSTGVLDDAGLVTSLSSLKDNLVGMGIDNNTVENLNQTISKNNEEITRLSVVPLSESEEDKKVRLDDLAKCTDLATSLNIQHACVANGVLQKIDGVLQKMNLTKNAVVEPPVVEEEKKPLRVVPVPIRKVEQPVIPNIPETTYEEENTVSVPFISDEDNKRFDEFIDGKVEPEDKGAVVTAAKDLAIREPEDFVLVDTKEASPTLKAKVQAWWQNNKKRVIAAALVVVAAAAFLTSCDKIKDNGNDVSTDYLEAGDYGPRHFKRTPPEDEPVIDNGGKGDYSYDDNTFTPPAEDPTPEPVAEEPSKQEEALKDYERPDEAKDTDYVLRVGEDGAAESISYENPDTGSELHYTTDGNIVNEDGAVIGQVPFEVGPNGEAIADAETVDEALKSAEENYQEKVDNFYEEAAAVPETGDEKPVEEVVEDFTPTPTEGTNITNSENELDNLQDAAGDIFADFGFETDSPSMGGK